ncbi:hypothetical protein B0H14DRAFT_3538151, partial [Mycena olivaceomarginata]
FDAGCSNCILHDHECDHGAPRSLCKHCEKGRLSHCSYNFAVADHARATNHLEPYTRLSNERVTSSSPICPLPRADYELAREQLFRASARIAEDLRPLWGQLLTDAEAELSIDYRAAIQCYPFISDPRWADLPTDEDLPTLIEFLLRRAAR